MKRFAPVVVALALAASQPACYGSYGAFHAVHEWNGHATGSRVGNSAVHFLLWLLPVYELCIAGDLLIFNNIEFLTGTPVFK